MGIVVEHDDGQSPDLQAMLALLLAQGQPAPPPQLSPIDEILAQLEPLIKAGANGRAPLNPHAVNGSGTPSYYVPPHEQPTYSRHGSPRSSGGNQSVSLLNSLLGGTNGSGANGYDKLANSNAQLQFRDQQHDQDAVQRDQQQAEMEAMRAADAMSRQQTQDVPQWIQQGLSQGALKYSPAQLRERQQANDAIDKLHNDPSWSPEQRAQLESRLREKVRTIDLAPQQVPWNERPVPPDQQYQSQLIMRPVQIDENTTLQLPVIPHTRNGQVEYRLSPEGEAARDVAIAKLKHQHALELEQIKSENKAATEAAKEAAKPPKETPEQKAAREIKRADTTARLSDIHRRIHDAQNDLKTATEARKKAWKGVEGGTPKDMTAVTAAIEAEQEAGKQLQSLEQYREDFTNQAQAAAVESGAPQVSIDPGMGNIDDMMMGDLNQMINSAGGLQESPNQPPAWYVALPSGAPYTAPDGSHRIKP